MVRDISGKHPGYYEAILQLRDCGEEAGDFVREEVAREGIYVAKEEKVKGGFDIYLGDKNFTRNLGRKLQERFGGEQKVTASLWGRKEGKEVYRLTVLFRGFGFRKGDKVDYRGEEYEVKAMGKEILLQKLETGEKRRVKYREKERIKKKSS